MNEEIKRALTQESKDTLDYSNKCLKALESLKKAYEDELVEKGRAIDKKLESIETYINGLREDLGEQGWKEDDIDHEILRQYDSVMDSEYYPLNYDYEILKHQLTNATDLINVFSFYIKNNES